MGVVERADRMRQRMDGAERLLERGRAHRRRRHHVRARLDVRCRPSRRAPGFPSPAACPRPRCRRPSGGRTGRNRPRGNARSASMPVPAVMMRRHADGQLRIADRHLRHHLRMEDDLLGVGRLVGDRPPARPTSEPVPAVVGTATIGRDAVGVGARPPVADVLEIPHRPRLAGHEGDHLAGIERRAAAEGDHAVMLAGACSAATPAATLASTGLGLMSEKSAAPSRRPQSVERRLRHRQLGEHRIGDEAAGARCRRLSTARRPVRAMRPAPKRTRGRIVPVAAQAPWLRSRCCRWKLFGAGQRLVADATAWRRGRYP